MNDEERNAWNARLFEQWQRTHGITPPKDEDGRPRAEHRRLKKAQADAMAQMLRAAKLEMERRQEARDYPQVDTEATKDLWEQIRDAMPPVETADDLCALCHTRIGPFNNHDHEGEEE